PLDAAHWTTRLLQIVWMAAILFVLRIARPDDDSRRVLIDACLLLILPLPLSGQLQPHHAVVMLPAAIVLLSDALDQSPPPSMRSFCLIAVAGAFLLMEYGPPKPWRGYAMNASFVLYFLGLTVARSTINRDCRAPPVALKSPAPPLETL